MELKILLIDGQYACVVKNLMSKEECLEIIQLAKSEKQKSKTFLPNNQDDDKSWIERNTIVPSCLVIENLNDRATKAFEEYLEKTNQTCDPPHFYTSLDVVHTLEGDDVTGIHYDGQEYGAVFYLNSSFSGGELFYLDKDYNQQAVFKPEEGMLVIHPWSLLHGVSPIDSGIRYSMTCFMGKEIPKEKLETKGPN